MGFPIVVIMCPIPLYSCTFTAEQHGTWEMLS